jgi:phosphoglycolate phosphatase-like HAD superfamily hydrolase
MKKKLLFLDFDGVVCDSVFECFYSATIAYYEKYLKTPLVSIPIRMKELFLHYRPFIRTGEDYIVLVDIVARGISIKNQEDFDRELFSNPPERLDLFRDLFYQTRKELIEKDFSHWMKLNPLYSGVKEPLEEVSSDSRVFILSTKVSDLIHKILQYYGVEWPEERILYPGKASKKELIQSVLNNSGAMQATLLDDQLDHLLVAREDQRIVPVLAAWGYVKPEWLKQTLVPTLERKDFRNFLRNSLSQSL